RGSYQRETRITSSAPAEVSESGLLFRVELPPHGEWTTSITVDAAVGAKQRSATSRSPGDAEERVDEAGLTVEQWVARAPELRASWTSLERTYRRSLVDLAALRFRSPLPPGALPAAGLPWFMTVFGRDSLLTSFQALPFLPELAKTTLNVLGIMQGRV